MPHHELFHFHPGVRSRCVTGSVLIEPGSTGVLCDLKARGVLRRAWLTTDVALTPELHRALVVRIYWDDAAKPAVDVPFGDFFGHIHGEVEFENAFFSAPSPRSYNCFIPMPFRRAARWEIVNASETAVRMYFELNWQEVETLEEPALYFHAQWRREETTRPGEDFVLLPTVKGSGRYLGTHCAVVTQPQVLGSWSEGDYRVFTDGVEAVHSLAADDQIGCAWGQNKTFVHQAYGRWEALLYREGDQGGRHSFYRYHLADPVFFEKELRVVTGVEGDHGLTRSDDWAATAFYYLDS